MQIDAHDVLLVIDVQNDFCPGGALAVPRGDEVIAPIRRIAPRFEHIILTQDWHPPIHFLRRIASRQTALRFHRAAYGPQTLWPPHCVQGTSGAEFHPALGLAQAELILRKGFRPQIDSYSAFFENDRSRPTGLADYLRDRGLTRVFLAGLAYDYCVGYSALDARRLGLTAFVLRDACRAIDLNGSVAAIDAEFAKAGVMLIDSRRAFRMNLPALQSLQADRAVLLLSTYVPQLLHSRRHAGFFALISGAMTLVPSSFQPGLPANGSLWRTMRSAALARWPRFGARRRSEQPLRAGRPPQRRSPPRSAKQAARQSSSRADQIRMRKCGPRFPRRIEQTQMYEVTVEADFSSGHYLRNYKGKCENPHGHNYKVRVTLAGATLDEAGLLLDFKLLKHVLRARHRPHRPPDAERPRALHDAQSLGRKHRQILLRPDQHAS
jgi:nicotinamidase/pyrazinamidase